MREEEDSFDADDENDPVVKEIPVYLSKRLENQLYMFQYPLRPKNPKTPMNVRRAFFKPQNQEVKLELNVNVESSNFDAAKAEDIAHEVDGARDSRSGGGKKDREVTFENDIVDKVIMTSTKVVQETDKYAIGVYNGKEYHLTPLKGFLQLRPSMDHLDKGAKRKKDAAMTNGAGGGGGEDEEEAGPSAAQAVTVKFARNDGEKSVKAREVSYRKLKEKSDAEKWVQCGWYKNKGTMSEVYKAKLISESYDDIGQAMNVTPSEYIKVLVPDDQEQAIMKPSLPSNVVSLHALRALPLQEQCRLLLKDAKIVQFQQLMMLLAGGDGLTPDALLKSLPHVGVLVRGNWVVKSEILYPPNTFSSVSGVPADLMCRARDYVLYLFTQNQYVERRKVCSVIRLPTEEVKEIFTGISRLRHNKGWELVVPIDADFIGKHNDLVQRQQLLWEQRSQQLGDLFKEGGAKEKRQRRKSKSVSEEPRGKKDPSVNSDTDSGAEKSKSPVAARKNKTKLVADQQIKVES